MIGRAVAVVHDGEVRPVRRVLLQTEDPRLGGRVLADQERPVEQAVLPAPVRGRGGPGPDESVHDGAAADREGAADRPGVRARAQRSDRDAFSAQVVHGAGNDFLLVGTERFHRDAAGAARRSQGFDVGHRGGERLVVGVRQDELALERARLHEDGQDGSAVPGTGRGRHEGAVRRRVVVEDAVRVEGARPRNELDGREAVDVNRVRRGRARSASIARRRA